VLTAEELEEAESFYRYLDVDGDHVPYRTLPGVHPKGAYFTRGSGHDKYGRYTESSEEYVEVVDRLLAKVESAGDHVPQPQIFTGEETVADVEGRAPAADGEGPVLQYSAPYGLVSIGGCHWAVLEARDELTRRGLDVDYMRIRGLPFNRTVEDFLAGHERIFVIEQNRDEQLRKLLTIETDCPKEKLTSITYYGGQPLSKGHVLDGLAEHIDVLEPREPAAAAT
jgi:2-oxoglutarate ferredoxin oxidoreductase subunit alpha